MLDPFTESGQRYGCQIHHEALMARMQSRLDTYGP